MKRENESQRGVSRREMLMRGGSAVAAAGIGPSIAAAHRLRGEMGGRPTSSSSWATMSASGTSAPITAA
jgi:hypothetical protein